MLQIQYQSFAKLAKSRPSTFSVCKNRYSKPAVATYALDQVVDIVAQHHSSLIHGGSQLVTELAANPVVGEVAGPLDFLAGVFEKALGLIDEGVEFVGLPYSYGVSIILLTVIVKVLTYPLTKQQVESQQKMQIIQPKIKAIQEQHRDNPEVMNSLMSQLYQESKTNPLAGCLPILATIPVFIGLYRSITQAAKEGLLTEGFFWIPSLGGPSQIGENGAGNMDWLFTWVDGAPMLGWSATLSYLVMPALLVVTQIISTKVMQAGNDQVKQQMDDNPTLKYITILSPLLIGWFSLSVPAGLTLYWFTNTIFTTAQQTYLKKVLAEEAQEEAQVLEATMSLKEQQRAEQEVRDRQLRKERGKEIYGKASSPRSSKFEELKKQEQQAKQTAESQRGAKFASLRQQDVEGKITDAEIVPKPTPSDLPSGAPAPPKEDKVASSNGSSTQ